MIRCKNCKEEIEEGFENCWKCGNSINLTSSNKKGEGDFNKLREGVMGYEEYNYKQLGFEELKERIRNFKSFGFTVVFFNFVIYPILMYLIITKLNVSTDDIYILCFLMYLFTVFIWFKLFSKL